MIRQLALLLVGLLAALPVTEVALRLVHPLWRIPYPPLCYSNLYEEFDPYGYRLRRGLVARDDFPFIHPIQVTIHSNGDGFRGRDLRERDGRQRIVVLGDSMVFGSGVEESERFTERLEAADPDWRVDNLGMVGFGPDLMLRALEQVGIALDPTVVLMAIFSHDFYRVMPEAYGVGFAVPRFVLVDGNLITVPYPARSAWGRLALVEGARYAYWRYTRASFALNAAILDRYRALAAAHHFVPAVAFLPSRGERWDDRGRARWLAGYARTHGEPFIDLSEPLRAAGFDRGYIPDDPHWNAAGHRVVADALRPFLAVVLRER
jgi:hypothetical protein